MTGGVRLHKWLVGATCLTLTLGILFASAMAGIGLQVTVPTRMLSGVGFDYGRGPSPSFAPLRSSFIRSVLGNVGSLLAGGDEPDQGQAARGAGSPTRPGAESGRDLNRVVDTHELTNDQRASARPITSIPFTARTRTSAATREADEPADCASTGGTVWYRYVADDDRALLAYTFGTDHPVSVGVFTAATGDDLRQAACDTDTHGNALVAFSAERGKTYLFQVTAVLGGGNLVFSLDPQGTTSLASLTSTEEEARGGTGTAVNVSSDGRFVQFMSDALNLPGGNDTVCSTRDPRAGMYDVLPEAGRCKQIYVRDRLKGTTELISTTSSGEPANARIANAFMTASGRYFTYETAATNIDPDDVDGGWDVFLHDRERGRTEKIPVASRHPYGFAREQYLSFYQASVSEDGRYVVFNSPAPDLVPDDTDLNMDVFVYDRATARTERVTFAPPGVEFANRIRNGGMFPSISADGRFVEFISDSPTLVAGDTNGVEDVFLHDRLTRTTERISLSSDGREGNAPSLAAGRSAHRRISADGRYVVFVSSASNLVEGDTNNGPDVFVRDRLARTTIRVASATSSSAVNRPAVPSGAPWFPSICSISDDGRHVVFDSSATHLAPGDAGEDWDVFLFDLKTQTTTLVTLSATGGDLSGQGPAVSADGRVVAYVTGVVERETDVTTDDAKVFVYEAPRPR